jgi:hypothetical protein
MADNQSILEIILQAKDLASEGIKKLKENLENLPGSLDKINEAFKTLKILPTTEIDAEKAKIIAAYEEIKNSGMSSAEEITRAEVAKNKAISDLNNANFTEQESLLTSFKEHWMAVSAAVVAGWMAINKAVDWAKIGAAALQAEQAFSQVTSSLGIDGDKLLAKMKEVSVGMVDDSALMQRAIGALQLGLDPEQIVSLLETARVAARNSGKDMVAAFDAITQAASTQMTKGLKSYEIVIDQSKAYEDYALKLGIAKDALTEQQQSQAIANAVIAEGLRQQANMDMSLINEAEQLQINKARFVELEESIGKGFVTALGLASKNIDAIGVAFAAAAIMNAPSAIKAIITALQTLGTASTTTLTAMKTGLVAIAAVIEYEVIKAIVEWATEYDKVVKDIKEGNAQLSRSTAELDERLSMLGFTGPDAWQKYEAAVKEGIIITDQATGKQTNLLEMIKQSISIMEAQVQTLQATSQYEIELVKKDYEDGKITMDQYLAFVNSWQTKITDAEIAAAQKRIEEAKKEFQMKTISEDEMMSQITVINESIKQIKIKAIQEQQQAYDAANKETLEKAQKTQEEEYNSWNNLQELKLNALNRELDLEDATDQAALQRGEMQQSEYLERKLERIKTAYEAEIQFSENVIKKFQDELDAKIVLTDEDLKIYQKAIEDKKKLQNGLQITIIKSEQDIADEKEKQAQKASNAVIKTVQEETSEFKSELDKQTAQLNDYMSAISDRRQSLEDTLSSMTTESFDDVKKYFANWGDVLSVDIDDMQAQIDSFMQNTTWTSYDTFWNATLYGRKMVEMVGTSIYDWAQNVTDYINYVRDLLSSLNDLVSSYQDQLDQLRGNEVAIVDRWYETELANLKDKYAVDLRSTKEYQEALTLLEELYSEKRIAAAEQEAEAKAAAAASGTSTSLGSAAGSLAGVTSVSFDDFAQQLQDSLAQSLDMSGLESAAAAGGGTMASTGVKEVNINANFVVESGDKEYLRRLFEDDLWPMFQKKFELMGIKF